MSAKTTSTVPGYISEKEALVARLKRVEGQVRGIQKQVESETYCIDILDQVSATTKALQAVALLLLDDHLDHCVAKANTPQDQKEKLAEASKAISRLVRS